MRAIILLAMISAQAGIRLRADEAPAPHSAVTVGKTGDFPTVQAAIDAAPAEGGVIRIQPGTYREEITVAKPHIELRGAGSKPEDVVLTFDKSAGTAGGTGKSASVLVTGDDFYAENLTIENSFSRNRPLVPQGSQAVALRVGGDRAVFRHVRFLGYQDTLYATSKRCESEAGPCEPARQYFYECYIEGNVDFIFGDAMAFFDHCEIHALAHATVYLTAQSKHYAEEKSGYVFDHCRLTTDAGAPKVWLGRPWRRYATVVFLHTQMGQEIVAEGWHEWQHDGKDSLPTAFYAEYQSEGAGAKPELRRQLTAKEAAGFALKPFLGGDDGWDPGKVR